MDTLTALKNCTVEGNVVKLPDVQLDRNVYVEVKKKLGMIGGTWKGGKTFGFVFKEDPTAMLEELAGGGTRNLQKEYQFFGTPDNVADQIIELADIPNNAQTKILEPEAGQGALIKALRRAGNDRNMVWACELMPLNKKALEILNDPFTKVIWDDFLTLPDDWLNTFERVIANPPFTKNQDIDHIRKMYEVCALGGRIVSCASNSWRTGSQRKQVEFREWLDSLDSDIIDIDRGAFKESGTNIACCIVTINK